ncbi:hypothetical protein ABDB91_09085 [Desulfoscipio sp. XC116]|uniref:hypothetical protein n=1 Tax=Desulfoscipio sp. XC116 TaxID=3144975 RepID=UPI00325B28F0
MDNKEYILWIYRNKDKNFLRQEHEYALALTCDNLSENIYSWSLPRHNAVAGGIKLPKKSVLLWQCVV